MSPHALPSQDVAPSVKKPPVTVVRAMYLLGMFMQVSSITNVADMPLAAGLKVTGWLFVLQVIGKSYNLCDSSVQVLRNTIT